MEMVIFEPWFQNTLKSIECNMPDLRDLFAMNAINGLLSFKSTFSEEDLARMSYKIADAMMKARNNK